MQGAGDSGWKHQPERGGRAPDARGLVVSALFFFPRGGSAQVTRSLARALPAAGWQLTLAAGSLGQPGELTHAASFFAGIDVHALDYSPALELAEPLAVLMVHLGNRALTRDLLQMREERVSPRPPLTHARCGPNAVFRAAADPGTGVSPSAGRATRIALEQYG